ncbi:hypothetical protein [Pseudomonas aeruginosa]|uniref:hypothetical protein n=1 Tax=Pseudomonas aeruginosa TaxID=287 RepID=UPI002112420B|nr:hypothetical protein [Pseudomonas aeruginosa]MCT9630700.1 hypothetical protein [Pseudomonas aeruginosa]
MKKPGSGRAFSYLPCAFSFFGKSGKLFLLINKKTTIEQLQQNRGTPPELPAKTVNKTTKGFAKVRIPSRQFH